MDMDTTNKEASINRPIRPCFMEQVLNDKTYVVPKVLGQQLGEGLSLAWIEKPDLSEALEMSGGVRFLLFVAVHSTILISAFPIFHLNPIRVRTLVWIN